MNTTPGTARVQSRPVSLDREPGGTTATVTFIIGSLS
jgi:hypothetical protein